MSKDEVERLIISLRVAVDQLADTKYKSRLAEFREAQAQTRFEEALDGIEKGLLAAPTAKGE